MRPSAIGAQRGVSLIEFVIVFPLAALFVLALIQVGFLFMAKSTLNHATFMAARAGSLNNADPGIIRTALARGLSPFYQDASIGNDLQRMTLAYINADPLKDSAYRDVYLPVPWKTQIDMLNPSADTFADYGVRDPVKRVTYIPNDNIEWRRTDVTGSGTAIAASRSKVNIRDANLLKLRVVYGYKLKVPLVGYVLKRLMCSGDTGVTEWGNTSMVDALERSHPTVCAKYYMSDPNGDVRVPIESFAIVEMQSRAEKP
ncbi:TadE family protein [Ideonella sp.]|uniref:TadE/TadG family type IV pilus assembly protein n=1 Tax=Ideonella sp. TaxID=1929293 RepID=UPI002B48B44D|nr:TadE family protein [Ideonella sp.]HJV70286.1 TadE family protein [Ideonella sp.]